MAKNNPTEKQIDAEIQATLRHAPAWKLTEEKMNIIRISEVVTQRMSCEKGVLKNFAKFTEKHLCQNLFFNKVAGLRQFY